MEARIKLSYSKKLMLIPISLSYSVLLPFISLSFSLLSWTTMRLSAAHGFQPQVAFSTRLSAARGLRRTTFSRIDKRKIRNHGFQPCKPECFLPASTANRPLGVAKSHAVKKKKKDGNQAVSAVTAAFPAKNIKRKGPKQQVVASDLCGWKPYVAAHSFQLQAMCRLKAYAAKPCTAESRMMKAV